jgi:hypothetical protein
MLATVLLSFGVGAATAAFTLVSADSPHSARSVACETMLQLSGDPFAHETENIRSASEMADAVSSWSDGMDDLEGRSLAPLFAAGALALLVACARGAARMVAQPRGPEVATASTVGALLVSATLSSLFGLPAMGLRAVAFAICVSMLAARFAQMARTELVPTRA